ncbi:MAG: hypothetical protein JSS91_03185 [Bacteroidetes bacterium]|nr:hypothetical protein [Bacteroidota bacterium]
MNNKNTILKRILCTVCGILLIYLTVTGSSCQDVINAISPTIPSEYIGSWKLVEQTGSAQDICSNETVVFQSSGQAQLTCPNSNTITRNYEVSNNVLTYTETSVSYNAEFSGNQQVLTLRGANVNRNLKYEKIATDIKPVTDAPENNSINSSDERR